MRLIRVLPRVIAPREEMMENVLAVSAFLCAALVGLAGDARVASYLHQRRWLRVSAFAVAFLVITVIVKGM
jgi:hypothetical protein